MSTTSISAYDYIVSAAEARHGGLIDHFTCGYTTEGGTYMIASAPTGNDSGRPRDLLAVLPAPVEGSRIKVLRPTVTSELILALRKHFDKA